MNSIDIIREAYKPYKITKKGKCTIMYSSSGNYVVKSKSDKNISELYKYLSSRGFHAFPKLMDNSRSDINVYEYIDSIDYPKEQKALDLINVVSNLHSSTSYQKEVREDKYKEIYDRIKGNIDYYKFYYEDMLYKIERERFMSPSHYLFVRSYSKINSLIKFLEKELSNWYDIVKDKHTIRESVVHNNLDLSHFIKSDDDYLISWENYIYGPFVLDFYNLYKREALNIDFKSVLDTYLKRFPLEEDERNLLFIMICIPEKIEFDSSEIQSCIKLEAILDYIYKTEELIRPYYSVDTESKKN